MELKTFRCQNENNDLDQYLDFYNDVRNNMEHPEWLGTFTKEEIEELLTIGGKLFNYYNNDEIVCSFFYLPCSNKSLQKHNIKYDESLVGSCGPIMVNPQYIGNGLQRQMIKELEEYCKSLKQKYIYTRIHPDNFYCINNFTKEGYLFLQTYTSPKDGEIRNDYLKEIS